MAPVLWGPCFVIQVKPPSAGPRAINPVLRRHAPDQPLQAFIGPGLLDACGLGRGLGADVVAAVAWLAAFPVFKVGVRTALAGAHRGTVDRLLKALRELHPGALPAFLDDDLRGDVAP